MLKKFSHDKLDNKKKSIKLEKKLSSENKIGDLVPQSGAHPLFSGDLKDEYFLYDNKANFIDDKISVSSKDTQKIMKEAFQEDRMPCLIYTSMNINVFFIPIHVYEIDDLNEEFIVMKVNKISKIKLEDVKKRNKTVVEFKNIDPPYKFWIFVSEEYFQENFKKDV